MKRFVSVLLVLLLMSGIGLEVFATSDEHVHTPGNWETLQEPTSEADGIQQTTCTTCNMVYTEPLHFWNADYTIDLEPSYEADGSKSIHCAVCDAVSEESRVSIPALTLGVPVLSAQIEDFKEIRLSWDPIADATGYRIYRQDGDAAPALIATLESGEAGTYTDPAVVYGTAYTYTITAVRNETESAQSAPVTAAILLNAPTVKVKAEAYNKVRINWNAIEGADGYLVYRKTSANGKWSRIVKLASAATTTCTDSKNVVPGSTYYYTVKAYRNTADNEEVYSPYNTAGVSVKPMLSTPKVKISPSYSKLTVSWAAVDGASGYYIYRHTGNGKWKKYASVNASTLRYVDTKVTYGSTYYYTVRAYRTVSKQNILSAYDKTGVKGRVYLSTPALKSAKATAYNKIEITWSEVAGAKGYDIYRKLPGKSWAKYATVSGKSTVTYTDSKAPTGTACSYTVRAYGKVAGKTVTGGYDSKGKTATANLSTPSLKKVSSVDYNKLKVTWNPVAGAEGYLIYRKTEGGSWSKVKKVTGQSTASYTDTVPKTGTTYFYTVKAYRTVSKKAVYGPYEKTGISGKASLPKPKLKSATFSAAFTSEENTNYSVIEVKWSKVSSAKGYDVYRRSSESNGKWQKIGVVRGVNNCVYNDFDLTENITYEYTVRAYRKVDGKYITSAHNSATVTCRRPYAPQGSYYLSSDTVSRATKVSVGFKNSSKRTMRVYSKGAALYDSETDEFDRSLKLSAGKSYVDIKPGQTVTLTFDIVGGATWYDAYTTLGFYFRVDGVKYLMLMDSSECVYVSV